MQFNKKSFIVLIVFVFISTFLLNYFTHLNLLVSINNTLILILSILLFKKYLDEKKYFLNFFIIASCSLIPLTFSNTASGVFSFFPLSFLVVLYLRNYISKKAGLFIFALFFFITSLYVSDLIKPPLSIQKSQLIFYSPEVSYHINRHQQDALFIPYSARKIVYSSTVYFYVFLTNFFNFINLKNLSDAILIANIYPLAVGIYSFIKTKSDYRSIFFASIFLAALVLGIDRSPDKFQSFYMLTPLLIYFIFNGANYVNKKIFALLWMLTILIILNPII